VGQNEIAEMPARITSATNVYVISLFLVIQEYSLGLDISRAASKYETILVSINLLVK
jgi:hypothetical protein